MYWEPAKYVAKLRTLKTDSNPLLLVTNMQAGHGGASGRYDYLKEIAFDYAFLLRELGFRLPGFLAFPPFPQREAERMGTHCRRD
jgi:protease II